jgi:WD40 repeat protein
MRQHFFFCIILLGLFVFTPVIAQQDEHVPTNLVPITPANADRLVRVGTLGRGYTFNIGYADNDTIMTVSAGGLWSYDADQISDPPDWQYNRLGFFTLRNHYGYRTLPPNVENWDDYIFEAWYEEGIESVIFTQSGHYVATHDRQFPDQCQRDASCMKKVILWDTITQTPKFEIIEPEIGGVTFALQDTYLGIIRAEETDFYDVTSGELVFTIPVSLDHFSTHGSTTAEVDSNDGDLKFVVWDIQSRQPVMELSFLPEEMISNVAFSDDGTRVAISSHMGDLNATIAIWDIRSRRRVATFEHGGQVTRMVFSPDNRYLAAYGWRWGADDDRLTIKLYDLATFQLRTTLPNNLWRSAVAVAFRPDGSQLAIVYVDGRMQTINTRTGDIIEEVRGYPGYPVDAAFTTNAIITTNAEDEIYLWHPDTFSPVGAHSDCTLLAYQQNCNI